MEAITGTDLLQAGYKEGPVLGMLLDILRSHTLEHQAGKDGTLALLLKLRQYPELFLDDEVLGKVASVMIEATKEEEQAIRLRTEQRPYTIYGAAYIEAGARNQMDTAMRLPVAVAGALMPDAHQGYGLPIGGVLAADNAVIPYGVGVDIGCRMALTIYDLPESYFYAQEATFRRELVAHTMFGAGGGYKGSARAQHSVLERKEFDQIGFVRQLHDKAYAQLGTSGGGNHFVEWGIIELPQPDEALGIPAGRYVALLSHSGSRGLGATIAGHYTRLAKQLCPLPKEAANLAYLSLDSEAGQEYWMAMNLAGDYASACHEVIHRKISKAIGGQILGRVENHHNFAWKEELDGRSVIVHRKGATPAGKGVMGIIPGSMTAPGFLVRGKGAPASIHSASHGAGRQMSRTKALQQITPEEMKAVLKEHGVKLIGAGLDEAPMAYKDIRMVMAAQQELVDVVATFTPKLVRMAADGSRED